MPDAVYSSVLKSKQAFSTGHVFEAYANIDYTHEVIYGGLGFEYYGNAYYPDNIISFTDADSYANDIYMRARKKPNNIYNTSTIPADSSYHTYKIAWYSNSVWA